MDGNSTYLKGLIDCLFSEFNKQPIHVQAEIADELEDFVSDWKIKHQHLRNNPFSKWKSGDHLVTSDESISNMHEQQEIKSSSDCKKGEKDDKIEAPNDSEMAVKDFLHEATTGKKSGMTSLLGFDGNIGERQLPLSMLFISSSLSAVDCKVETETHAGRVFESQLKDWTQSKCLDTTAELLESKVPIGVLDECNSAAATAAHHNDDDYDDDDDEDKNGNFASFKKESVKEDEDYSNESLSVKKLSDAQPKSRRTRLKLNNEENWKTRGKKKAKKTSAQPPHPPHPPHPQQLTVCEICGARVKIIKVHMMQHGERLHTCPYCNYSSHQRGTVDVHIRCLHTNDRPHLCEICGKGFVKSSLLKEHISVKHNQMKRERSFICSECSFSTYTRTLLHAHTINRHTPYRRQVYKCDQCDAQLCSAHSLKEHQNLCHTNERPFPCSMCEFAAKSAKRLKNHMIYHSEKAFKCETCGKMFYTRPQLRRHQLVHTRTTDFSCPYCSYQCSLAENLRKHCRAIHKVTYPAKKRLNYRREFPKPKQPKETTEHLEETVTHCISLPPVLEMINCSA